VALPFYRVYVATAVASGGTVGVCMNDSGFWVFARMSGLSEVEPLKTYTPLLVVGGIAAMSPPACCAWSCRFTDSKPVRAC
jgi:GntP family gluconate:H+ symporter